MRLSGGGPSGEGGPAGECLRWVSVCYDFFTTICMAVMDRIYDLCFLLFMILGNGRTITTTLETHEETMVYLIIMGHF